MEFSTSVFRTADYANTTTVPSEGSGNVSLCRYEKQIGYENRLIFELT